MSRIAEPEGVDEEWARVYADHGPAVFSFAFTWLCDVVLAEEVVQDVFVNVWSEVDCFDHARGSLRFHLLAQTRRCCLEIMRPEAGGQHCQVDGTGISFTPGDEAQVAVAGKAVVLDGMRSALAQLPLDERLPINLAYLGKLTYTEIAQVLEWPEGTVTMGILRGLHRLREREKLH